MRVASLSDSSVLKFNYQSLKNALRELEIEFKEGPRNFVMECFFDEDCQSGRNSLWLAHIEDKAGIFHCFKCGAHGHLDEFVRRYTAWGAFRVAQFMRRHRACEIDPEDEDGRLMSAAAPVTEQGLKEFQFRHDYCTKDRGINEPTLRRYKIGFDSEENDIIIPWFDRVGKLIAFKRRSLLGKFYRFETDKDVKPLLFGLHLVRPRGYVWITEGEFDAMFLDQCFRQFHKDDHFAVALGGKYLQAAAQVELLKKNPTSIILATDNDDDGREAADNIYGQLRSAVHTQLLRYPVGEYKDPNVLPLEIIIAASANFEKSHDVYRQRMKERTA